MQDRDKCEDKIILLQNAVVGKDGEIESLHEQVCIVIFFEALIATGTFVLIDF